MARPLACQPASLLALRNEVIRGDLCISGALRKRLRQRQWHAAHPWQRFIFHDGPARGHGRGGDKRPFGDRPLCRLTLQHECRGQQGHAVRCGYVQLHDWHRRDHRVQPGSDWDAGRRNPARRDSSGPWLRRPGEQLDPGELDVDLRDRVACLTVASSQ